MAFGACHKTRLKLIFVKRIRSLVLILTDYSVQRVYSVEIYIRIESIEKVRPAFRRQFNNNRGHAPHRKTDMSSVHH